MKVAKRLQAFIDQFDNLLGPHVKDEMRRAIEVLNALNATEPEKCPTCGQPHVGRAVASCDTISEPKARPAFLGDRTEWLDGDGVWNGPAATEANDDPKRLRHTDGAPVSRVVPFPREIKESQLLTLEELEDGERYQGVTVDGRASGDVGADLFRRYPHWYTGYLPVPKIKRGE